MKKLMTFLVITLFLITLTSATLDSLGTFKQNDNVRITQVCYDATYINISSISYPDSTVADSNIAMVYSGNGEYYYDFNSTSILGRYDVRGTSDGCTNTFATYFDITSTGKGDNPNFYYIVLIIAFVLLILGFYVQDLTFIRFGGMILLLMGLYVIIFGFPGIKDAAYTWGIGIILTSISSYILIKSSHEAIEM